jgi:hypothetical protein
MPHEYINPYMPGGGEDSDLPYGGQSEGSSSNAQAQASDSDGLPIVQPRDMHDFDPDYPIPSTEGPSGNAITIVDGILATSSEHNVDVKMTDAGEPSASNADDSSRFFGQEPESSVSPEELDQFEETVYDNSSEDESADADDEDDMGYGLLFGATGSATTGLSATRSHRGSTYTTDPSTEVPRESRPFEMSEFELAYAHFAKKWKVSRSMHRDLRAILQLLPNPPPVITTMPKRIDKIKQRLDQQTPSLPTRRVTLALDPCLLPTRTAHEEHMRLFDMRDFFRSYLQSSALMKRVHTGMAHYVDQPIELYHSEAWGGSNRTTSGQFAKVQFGSGAGQVILASDFVWFMFSDIGNILGRVVFVGQDYRSEAEKNGTSGRVKLSIQPINIQRQLPESLHPAIVAAPALPPGQTEIFLLEDVPRVEILEDQLIKRESSVYLDYAYKSDQLPPRAPLNYRLVCRRIASLNPPSLRELALSHPHRGELEIAQYRRAQIIENLCGDEKRVQSFPYTFGLYRNMYRPTTGYYLQFAFLNESDRKRRMNVFPITLGPFGAKWEDIVAALVHLRDLEFGIEIQLDTGEHVTVCAPCLAYVGDMPQQQNNAGCKSQNAKFFCRSCLIGPKDKGNIRYDVVANGRYHFEMKRVRAEANHMAKNDWVDKFKKIGLADKESPLTTILTPALCMPLAFPGDGAHSEFKGIAKQILNVLFTDIIKPTLHDDFARQFAATPTPSHWPAIQNIKKYLGSFTMQEFGRAIMISPVVLRVWLRDFRLRDKYFAGTRALLINRERRRILGETSDSDIEDELELDDNAAADFIVHCFATIARCDAVFMGPYVRREDRPRILELIYEARDRYVDIINIAVSTGKKPCDIEDPHSPMPQPSGSACPGSPLQRDATAELTSDGEDSDRTPQPLVGEEEDADVSGQGKRSKSKSVLGAEAKRIEALSKKTSTPNVHTIVHFPDSIIEYASARNVMTWSGEDRHA